MDQISQDLAKYHTQVLMVMNGVFIPDMSWAASTLWLLVHRYYLQFHAVKGITPGYVGLDDFSMSPECFGFGKLKRGIIFGNSYLWQYFSLLWERSFLSMLPESGETVWCLSSSLD